MKLIIACDKNGGIGYKNKLPWNKIEGDLPRFKRLTNGGVIVMGRKTWESLSCKPLPNRINFIVTSNKGFYPGSCFTIPSIDHISNFKDAWIIGGAKLIKSAWDYLDEIHLTQTFTEYTCDCYIDIVKLKNEFKIVRASGHGDHSYEIYRRKK